MDEVDIRQYKTSDSNGQLVEYFDQHHSHSLLINRTYTSTII